MAIDKAIDSTAFDSKLKSVADAIRSAGGTTEPMSFPSGMVEAISVLKSESEAGGGTICGKKFISGNITFSETPTGEFTVEHEEWNVNNYGGSNILVFLNGSTAPTYNGGALILLTSGSGVYINSRKYVTLLSSISKTISDSTDTVRNDFTIKAEAAKKMLAGKTYTWMRVAYA